MLAQLPGDLDVEEMVTASYNLVLEHHLDKKALHVRDPSFTQRGLSHMWDRVKSMSRASALILASNAGRDDLPQTAAGGRGSILALLNAARRKSNVVAPSPMEPDGAAAATNRRGSLLTLITAAQQSAMRKSVDAAASSNQVLPTSDPNYDIEMQAPSNASSKGIGSKRAQSLLHAHELLSDKQLFHPAVRSSVDLPMPPHLDNKALDPVSDPFSSSLYQSSHTVTRGVNQEGSNALSPEPPALSPSMDHDESAMKLQAMKMASGLLTDFGPTLNAFSSPSSATHKPMVNRGAATATSSTAADQVASALMALMENDDEPKVETN